MSNRENKDEMPVWAALLVSGIMFSFYAFRYPWFDDLLAYLMLVGLIALPVIVIRWLFGITFGFLGALLTALCPGLGRRDLG